jgi:hypothetical protein
MIISRYENIFIKIGTFFQKEFLVKDFDNNVIDLTGYTIEAKFSNSILPINTINSDMVKIEPLDSSILVPLDGKIIISSNNTNLYKFGRYMYQINLIDGDDKKFRVFEGILTIDP